MICKICDEEQRCLGNHLRKHGITAREYKIKFNLPIKKALFDDDWIERMREIGNDQKQSTNGRAHLEKLANAGKKFTAKVKSGEIPHQTAKRNEWPECSRLKVNQNSQKLKNSKDLVEVVLSEWLNGVPVKELSISSNTAKDWVNEGVLPKRKRKVFHKAAELI